MKTLAFLAAALVLAAAPALADPPAIFVADEARNVGGAFGYSASGAAATGYTTPAGFQGARGVAYNPANNTLYVSDAGDNPAIRTFNATTGAETQLGFAGVTGLNRPSGMAITGNTLLVANAANNELRAFNASTGAPAAYLVPTGLSYPVNLTLAATTLYVANVGTGGFTGTVNAYNSLTGVPMPGFSVPTGLGFPSSVAVLGNVLFIAETNRYRVGAYDATTGAVLNAGFITGTAAFTPQGLAIQGNRLLVVNSSGGTVGAYGLPDTITAGVGPTSANANFITGLTLPEYLVVVPEPSTWALLAGGMIGLAGFARRHAART